MRDENFQIEKRYDDRNDYLTSCKKLKNDPILRSFTANGRTDERIGGWTNRAKLIENFR